MDEPGGPPASFEEQYATLFECGYRASYRLLGNRADAEEIAQEALARCLERWAKVGGYAEAWVTTTASNLAIDRYRRRSRRLGLERRESTSDPDAELRADLVAALRSLSRRQRDVVVLRYLLDRPEREVAAALGLSEGAVKRHAQRGLKALRARLGEGVAGGGPEESEGEG